MLVETSELRFSGCSPPQPLILCCPLLHTCHERYAVTDVSRLLRLAQHVQESVCSVDVFRRLQLEPQQLRLARGLWQSWSERRRELDVAVRGAVKHLEALASTSDLVSHGTVVSHTPPPTQPLAPPPGPRLPAAPWPRPQGTPWPRRNTLPPLHGDLQHPSTGARGSAVGWAGVGGLGSGWGVSSAAAMPRIPSPSRRLRRFSSGGSGGGSGSGSDPGGGSVACVCSKCVEGLAPKLLGVGVGASVAAQAAMRQLLLLQEQDLALCAHTVLGVSIPGAFFSSEQMLIAAAALPRHGVVAVDWLWVVKMANDQLRMSDCVEGFDHTM